MFAYIVEFAERKILVQTDSKENLIKNILSDFEKKNIRLNSENVILEMYNSELNLYYEVNPSQLPDKTVLVKVVDAAESAGHSTTVEDHPISVGTSNPEP